MNDQSVAATRVYGVGHKAQHHLAPLRKIQRVGGLGPLTTIIFYYYHALYPFCLRLAFQRI